jgi:hypothetical protein
MDLDALPGEIGEVIFGRAVRAAVASERAKGCARLRAVCQTWRSASDAALRERYEAQVRDLISNMRIRSDDHLPRRYVLMYAFGPCRSPFRSQMRYVCGTCGSPVAEIAKCDSCQSDRLPLASSAPPPSLSVEARPPRPSSLHCCGVGRGVPLFAGGGDGDKAGRSSSAPVPATTPLPPLEG